MELAKVKMRQVLKIMRRKVMKSPDQTQQRENNDAHVKWSNANMSGD